MPDTSRIDELKRRVQRDPASIAFAQLAEEYRRAGQLEEAINACRTGLQTHPGYLSARVTLGRALLELGELDGARAEFLLVLQNAPDHLAATRALAEVFRRAGDEGEARHYCDRALTLAPNDPDLERLRARLSDVRSRAERAAAPSPLLQRTAGAPTTPPAPAPPPAAEAPSPDQTHDAAMIAALERWLEAIDATRAERRA